MSMPSIPNIEPIITLDAEKAAALLLASMAMEGMALSHIINAEAEKIQYVLGTLKGPKLESPPSFKQLMELDDSVSRVLKQVAAKQMLIHNMLCDLPPCPRTVVYENTATVTGVYRREEVSDSDIAYYHKIEGGGGA